MAGGGSRTTVDAGGTLNILGATTMELNGALLVNNGTVTGTVNVNYGSLAKGTGTYDVVNVNEGGVYSPGSSPGISTATSVEFENGLFASGAPRLVLELGGVTPGTQYDQLHVSGQLKLGGTLEVSLIDGFTPQAGNSFDILDFNPANLSGTFSTLALPTLAGLAWDTTQLYTTGILSLAAPGLSGDFNLDNAVDAADYVLWRKNPGGIFTPDDYNTWRTHFGQTAAAGATESANLTAVPEPSSLVLLLLTVTEFLLVCRLGAGGR